MPCTCNKCKTRQATSALGKQSPIRTHANSELEGLLAVARAVELLAIRERASVVHRNLQVATSTVSCTTSCVESQSQRSEQHWFVHHHILTVWPFLGKVLPSPSFTVCSRQVISDVKHQLRKLTGSAQPYMITG